MKKKNVIALFMTVLLTAQIFTGCGSKESSEAETENAQVATAEEMATPEELDTEGLKEVSGDLVKDGVYDIDVDCSSSMFKIESCELTVEDGEMTAVMTMGGKGYLKVFMGTGAEAVLASEEEYIPFEENALGQHTYTVPVEALDKPLDCAAFSKDREKWYERTLIFRASSLPVDAFEDGVVTTPDMLGLEDGTYTVEMSLEGGTGKASVESPATLTVQDGQVFVEVIWSSANYDYMKVDDQRYELVDTEGNSNFIIPVSVFDWNMPIIADTIAMSEPHEIEYTLLLDSSSIVKAE